MRSYLLKWQIVESQTLGFDQRYVGYAYIAGRQFNSSSDNEYIQDFNASTKYNHPLLIIGSYFRIRAVEVTMDCDERDDIGRKTSIVTTICPTLIGWIYVDLLFEEVCVVVGQFAKKHKRHLSGAAYPALRLAIVKERDRVVERIAMFVGFFAITIATILVAFFSK